MLNSSVPYFLSSFLFFPYLPYGIKVEYIFVFGCVIFFLIPGLKVPTSVLSLSGSLFLALAPLLVSTAYSVEAGVHASPFNMFARLALPGAMLLCFSLLLTRSVNVFDHSIRAVVYASSFLALVSISTYLFPDFAYLLSPWVSGDLDGVWYQSTSLGRVVGVFNQPLEAGLFYSVALLACIVKFKLIEKSKVSNSISLAFILVAGILTLSKVFLILGCFLGILFAVFLKLISFRFLVISIPFFYIVPIFINSHSPAYIQSLFELYHEGGWLFSLTAGRLGSDSENSDLYVRLLEGGNWIFGFGLGSQLPLDSGYLEFFYQGGVLALIGYLMFISMLFLKSIRIIETLEGKLLIFLTGLILLASVGGPVISAGRANISLIILLTAIIISFSNIFKSEKARA